MGHIPHDAEHAPAEGTPSQKNENTVPINPYPSLTGLPTSREITMLDDDLTELREGGVGPGVWEGAQAERKGGKRVGMIPGLTSGPREEDLAGGRDANGLGSLGSVPG